jgi:hypothetical protein
LEEAVIEYLVELSVSEGYIISYSGFNHTEDTFVLEHDHKWCTQWSYISGAADEMV